MYGANTKDLKLTSLVKVMVVSMFLLSLKSKKFFKKRLHDYNQLVAKDRQINIQGFAVGNGCTHET